ncbi:MAG: tRNA pseudouridine(55) synthase TruB [Bacteroidota bacterium]|nr:tRNA pseudouridine(55) synthase TruB [Candidatus Kapabacteria bacterium]MDW8219472.1 tRNA pseudouridine(55) synthase TruB [Bacteroidota bacterium]
MKSFELSPLLTRAVLDSPELYAAWLEKAREHGGIALVDKASGWTSFDVIAKLRGLTRIRKVGHAGTLDPLATGLLILCFGACTKSLHKFQEYPKVYDAVVKLGATTQTDDAEAPEENIRCVEHLHIEHVRHVLQSFVGDVVQIPPMFSAVKKNGVRLYKLARKGAIIEREARHVKIEHIDLLAFSPPYCKLQVICSKGTYIRSLARDIGASLGVGGYLFELRRTRIGMYSTDSALTVHELESLHHTALHQQHILLLSNT